jgi:glycosyltransferase involved in cell wall biosynthesis
MPKVSVVIPTYNRRKYVVKAIQSVLEQSANDYEILVVDDGSTDDTQCALKPYADKIRYFHQKNSGVSSSRNRGIREATGDWICFLDSDDEWTRNYLNIQLGLTRKYPEAIGHIANSVSYALDGDRKFHFAEIGIMSWFRKQSVRYCEKPFRAIIAAASWYLQPTLLRREAVLHAGLFDESLTIAEDIDLIGRVALQGPFTFNCQVLVEVFRRPEEIRSLSFQYSDNRIYSRSVVAKVYQNFLKSPQLTILEKCMVAKTLARTWRSAGNFLINGRRTIEAREYYRRSFLQYPSPVTSIKYLATFLPHDLSSLFVRKGKGLLPEDPVAETRAGDSDSTPIPPQQDKPRKRELTGA